MAGRRAARRTALVLLYQWDVTGQELASLYDGEIDPFSRELAEAVVAEHEQLDVRITEAADEWTADRLGALERNILRMAILELGATPGRPLPGLARAVQERVGETLAQVTGLEVERVDVEIVEIG